VWLLGEVGVGHGRVSVFWGFLFVIVLVGVDGFVGLGGYSGVMSGSAEDLDRLVEFAGDGPWAGAGVVIVLGSQPDANAPHGINDEDEML